MFKKIALAAAVTLIAGSVMAQSALKPEDMIKYRKAGYSFMSWNMGKLKGMLVDNPASFNKDQAIAAANAIQGIANSGMGALYGPGTDKDVGDQKTRVKPEFFQRGDDVKKVAVAFNKEANELAKVAATGDAAALKVQFGKVGETCKSCHDDFRKKD